MSVLSHYHYFVSMVSVFLFLFANQSTVIGMPNKRFYCNTSLQRARIRRTLSFVSFTYIESYAVVVVFNKQSAL